MSKFLDNNQKYIGEDFAGAERRAFLAKLPYPKKFQNKEITHGFKAGKVWNVDVSGGDKRSVKAQLNGKGDYRVLWWQIYSTLHIAAGFSLEQTMYRFHSMHHKMTLSWIKIQLDFNEVRDTIIKQGAFAGINTAVKQSIRDMKNMR